MSFGTGTVVAQYEKEPSTLKILKCATDANPLFEGLDDQQRTIVYGAFVEETYEADEIIIREGDRGDIFYVVETGAFDAQIKARGDETVAHYESTGFGELALLYNSPRAATVRCIKAGRLWAIDRAVFNVIMIESRTSAKSEVEAFLNSSVKEVTQYFEPSHFDIFSQLMDEVCFSVGETIWRAGEPVDCLYFVREGEVSITNEKEEESYRLRRASLDTSLNSFRARRHAVLKRGRPLRQRHAFGVHQLVERKRRNDFYAPFTSKHMGLLRQQAMRTARAKECTETKVQHSPACRFIACAWHPSLRPPRQR